MVMLYIALFVAVVIVAIAAGKQNPKPDTTPKMFPEGPPEDAVPESEL